ncbi:MAG: formylmethanofuran dehydrogenase subunit C [Nevskia sp.]|nr:formylmethanofuran dehydrogenase subunit C [Nevskia sp.]
MSGLILTLKPQAPEALDGAGLLPASLAGLSPAEAARRPLAPGIELGECFTVQADPAAPDHRLTLRTGARRLARLGCAMDGGTLRVVGDAGDLLGQDLRGGEIVVEGGCGAYAGAGQRAGLIRVRGDAGDFLGGAADGYEGMRGGVLLVQGRAGARAGWRMRRGLIAVAGGCGDWCGAEMLAGTLVAPRCGARAGLGLRRGSLVLWECPPELPATFNDAGVAEFVWLARLDRWLAALEFRLPPLTQRARRLVGDQGAGGKGEILIVGG